MGLLVSATFDFISISFLRGDSRRESSFVEYGLLLPEKLGHGLDLPDAFGLGLDRLFARIAEKKTPNKFYDSIQIQGNPIKAVDV